MLHSTPTNRKGRGNGLLTLVFPLLALALGVMGYSRTRPEDHPEGYPWPFFPSEHDPCTITGGAKPEALPYPSLGEVCPADHPPTRQCRADMLCTTFVPDPLTWVCHDDWYWNCTNNWDINPSPFVPVTREFIATAPSPNDRRCSLTLRAADAYGDPILFHEIWEADDPDIPAVGDADKPDLLRTPHFNWLQSQLPTELVTVPTGHPVQGAAMPDGHRIPGTFHCKDGLTRRGNYTLLWGPLVGFGVVDVATGDKWNGQIPPPDHW